ncbi:MAG: helix-turn-helix transcriptional regulator [Butyricicoccus sp.]|nr:helix-turn-helix transcriptional regulator [Butyricicoccus sp.]
MAVSLRLKPLRLAAGQTQNEVAGLLGVSREAYSMYESGKRQPGLEALDILAAHFRVSVDYLIGRSDCPEPAEPLTDEERALLAGFRALDARGKRTVEGVLALEQNMQNGPS